jgi:polysaccharide biosynthesis/export protein
MSSSKMGRKNKFWSRKFAPQNYLVIGPSFRGLKGMLVFLFVLGFLFLGGCGRHATQYKTFQNVPNLQGTDPNKQLQQQLMIQAAQASVADYRDYKVGPEDLLAIGIETYGQGRTTSPEESAREIRVNGQGQITMPLVGVVQVGGLTTQEIEQRLKELYGANYLRNPQITVKVKEFHHQQVAVTGAVTKPGSYEIIGPRSLLEVLAMAGGIANDPNRAQAADVVHLIRRQKGGEEARTAPAGSNQSFSPHTKTTVINLRRLLSGEATDLNVSVQAGDVVHVPFAGNAYVLGGVMKPGSVAVKQNLTVSQAVAMAGGVDPLKGTYKIILMRFDKQGRPVTIETNLLNIVDRKDPDLPVKDNDVIMVKGGLKRSLWVIRQILPIPSGGYAIPTQ